jgi:hypothetical protein
MTLMPKPHRPSSTRLGLDLNHMTFKLHIDIDLASSLALGCKQNILYILTLICFLFENMKKQSFKLLTFLYHFNTNETFNFFHGIYNLPLAFEINLYHIMIWI